MPGPCRPDGVGAHLLQGQVGPVPEQPAVVGVEHGAQDVSLGGQARPRQPLPGDVALPPQRRQQPHCGRDPGTASAPDTGTGHRLCARRRSGRSSGSHRPTTHRNHPGAASYTPHPLGTAPGPAGCWAASGTVALFAGQGTSSRFQGMSHPSHATLGAAIFPLRRASPSVGGTIQAGRRGELRAGPSHPAGVRHSPGPGADALHSEMP